MSDTQSPPLWRVMNLRPDQQQAVTDLRNAYGRGRKRVCLVMPTGGGKTVVFSHIARLALTRGGRVLVLVHRSELIDQTCRTLERVGVAHGVIAAGRPTDPLKRVQVASVQTLARRLDQYGEDAFQLVIVDEAHHANAGTWAKVLSHFSGARVLGVTATPVRGDGRGLGEWFEELVMGPTAAWLTDRGLLASARVFSPPIGFDAKGLHRRMGDYDMREAGLQLSGSRQMGDAVSHYRQLLGEGTAIAFCCSIAHAEATAEAFNAQGISAASIDGGMTTEQRRDLLKRLGCGDLRVLTSCELIGEGVDVPSVGGCIMLRPTQSLGLYLQMVGRCLRPQEGKVAVILDHVGNVLRHGHHLEEREWSLDGVKKRERTAAASLKVCPECFATIRSVLPECTECGHVFKAQDRKLQVVAGSLVEHDASARKRARAEQGRAQSLEALVAVGMARGMRNPRGWARHVLAARARR